MPDLACFDSSRAAISSFSATAESACMTAISSPGMMPLAGVSGRPSKSCCAAPVATITWPGRELSSSAPANPIATTHRGLNTSHANCAAIAAATLPTPPTMTTRPPPSQM